MALGSMEILVRSSWPALSVTVTNRSPAVMPKGRPETIDGIAPNDPVEEFAADVDVWQEDTLVVGHLPFMSRLVSLLMSGEPVLSCLVLGIESDGVPYAVFVFAALVPWTYFANALTEGAGMVRIPVAPRLPHSDE